MTALANYDLQIMTHRKKEEKNEKRKFFITLYFFCVSSEKKILRKEKKAKIIEILILIEQKMPTRERTFIEIYISCSYMMFIKRF